MMREAAPESVRRIAAQSLHAGHLKPLLDHRPLVLTGIADQWPARRRWTFDWLQSAHDATRVMAVQLDRRGAALLDPRTGLLCNPTSLGSFVRALQRGECAGYVMTDLEQLPSEFARDAPVPHYCPGTSASTSRLWISAGGTHSVLHFDVAHNLHTVLRGKKRVTLYSWTQSHLLYPRGLLSSMPNASHVDLAAPDYLRFPKLRQARPLAAELSPGDMLFLPGGWWHHVQTVEDCISVNAFFAAGLHGAALTAVTLYKRLRGLSR
jgi:hypothetical protein